jgi:parallel beta-helix repeat protein
MSVSLSPVNGAAAQFFDNNGNPLSGGKLFTYQAGTTTPQATYTTSAGNVAHANPIILDSAGRIPGGELWLLINSNYKFRLEDSVGTLVWTVDDVPSGIAAGTDISAAIGNASALTVITTGSTTARSLANRFTDVASVLDFIPLSEHAAIAAGTSTYNCAADLTAAFAAGNRIYFPQGSYYIGGDTLTIPSNRVIYGDGEASKIIVDASGRVDPFSDHILVLGSDCTVRDLLIDGDRADAVQEIRSIFISSSAVRCLIENVTFKDQGVGVWVEDASEIFIRSCRFIGTVSKSHIVTSGASGFAERLIIEGNYFGSSVEEAIDVNAKTRGVVITGNVFFDNHTGPDVDGTEVIDIGSNSDCFDITITGNRCNGNSAADAFVWVKLGSSRVSIVGNAVTNLDLTGEAVVRITNSKHVTVANNVCQSVPRLVRLTERSSTIASEYITISGNTASAVALHGIFLDNCTNVTTDVTITGNVLNTTTATEEGMHIVEADNLIIAGNTIRGFGDDGVKLDSSVTRYVVNDNVITGCSDGISTTAVGGVFTGNRVHANTVFGLRLSANECTVSGNQFTSNTQSGIAMVAAANCAITGNVCRSNGVWGLHVTSASADSAVVGNMFLGNTSGSIGSAANLTGSSVNASNVV